MSGKVAGLAWDHYPGDDQGELLTALFLADAADHLGRNVYPSASRIAFFTRQSERTVRYQLKRMRSAGFLIQEGSGLGGRGMPTKYHIDLQWLKCLPDRSQQWEEKRVQILQTSVNPASAASFDEVKPCKKRGKTLQKPCSLIAGEPQNRGTLKTTTTTPDGAGAEGGGVHFDELPHDLKDKARQLVVGLPEVQQVDVIDELLGQLQEGVAKLPERLLKTLAQAAATGSLTLDHARRYRERRRTREVVESAARAASAPPLLDEEAKKKGATLLQRLAPSVASRLHSSSQT